MDVIQATNDIIKAGGRKAVIIRKTADGQTRKVERLGQNSVHGPLLLSYNKRNSGTPVSWDKDIIEVHPVGNRVTPTGRWAKQVKRAVDMLAASGLWPELMADGRVALEIGYEKIQAARKVHGDYADRPGVSYEERQKQKVAEVKAIDPRMVAVAEDGHEYVKTDFIWHWDDVKIKRMNFGRTNEFVLAKIAEAMRDGKALSDSGRTSYDVSFEYQPDKKKAWYSEEFRGYGNGHYYLALNATHVMFYEDD